MLALKAVRADQHRCAVHGYELDRRGVRPGRAGSRADRDEKRPP